MVAKSASTEEVAALPVQVGVPDVPVKVAATEVRVLPFSLLPNCILITAEAALLAFRRKLFRPLRDTSVATVETIAPALLTGKIKPKVRVQIMSPMMVTVLRALWATKND